MQSPSCVNQNPSPLGTYVSSNLSQLPGNGHGNGRQPPGLVRGAGSRPFVKQYTITGWIGCSYSSRSEGYLLTQKAPVVEQR